MKRITKKDMQDGQFYYSYIPRDEVFFKSCVIFKYNKRELESHHKNPFILSLIGLRILAVNPQKVFMSAKNIIAYVHTDYLFELDETEICNHIILEEV